MKKVVYIVSILLVGIFIGACGQSVNINPEKPAKVSVAEAEPAREKLSRINSYGLEGSSCYIEKYEEGNNTIYIFRSGLGDAINMQVVKNK